MVQTWEAQLHWFSKFKPTFFIFSLVREVGGTGETLCLETPINKVQMFDSLIWIEPKAQLLARKAKKRKRRRKCD